MTLAVDLWPRQQRVVDAEEAATSGRLLECWMGAGKTLMALALCDRWQARRILVTCPKSVVGGWEREVREFVADDWIVARCDDGSSKKKAQRAELGLGLAGARDEVCLVVVNHESLWRPEFTKVALGAGFDVLIVDESHRAKAPGGKFSRFLQRLESVIPRKLGLTGTPCPHSPLDIYAQGRFLNPRVFGTNFARFRAKYAQMGGFENKQVVGYQNVEEFRRRYKMLVHTMPKDEVIDGLPPWTDMVRSTPLEPKARKLYSELDAKFYAQVDAGEITISNALVKVLRLLQLSSGTLKTDEGRETIVSTAKENLLYDVLQDVEAPVVVFGRFTQDLAAARRVAEKLGWKYGEISGDRKDGLSDDARLAPGVDLCGVQLQAGGVGIDLTDACVAVFYSLGTSLGDYLQARARIHRPRQTRPVAFVHLLAEKTRDAIALRALQRREDVIAAIVYGKREL